MRYAVLADIHSNLEALGACLNVLKQEKPDGYLVLGDIVGYGTNPNECIERVRQLPNLKAIMGNHDLTVIGKMDLEWFKDHAHDALVWTIKNLKPENKAFLEALPQKLEIPEDHFLLVHGSPQNPIEEYLIEVETFVANLKFQTQPICFVGHSHAPVYFCLNKKDKKVSYDLLEPNREKIYNPQEEMWVINPGSVGQPRDRNPKASFLIVDTEKKTLKNFRVDYPIGLTQEKILKAGLPSFLADRLSIGK